MTSRLDSKQRKNFWFYILFERIIKKFVYFVRYASVLQEVYCSVTLNKQRYILVLPKRRHAICFTANISPRTGYPEKCLRVFFIQILDVKFYPWYDTGAAKTNVYCSVRKICHQNLKMNCKSQRTLSEGKDQVCLVRKPKSKNRKDLVKNLLSSQYNKMRFLNCLWFVK